MHKEVGEAGASGQGVRWEDPWGTRSIGLARRIGAKLVKPVAGDWQFSVDVSDNWETSYGE